MSPKQKLAAWLGAGALATATTAITLYEGNILHAYKDPVGIWTACVGETSHVVTPGDIKPGARYTPEQCRERLYISMAQHAEPVMRCTAPALLTTGQKVAYLSFAFNVGGSAFCGSTLAKKARAGDVAGSCAELSRWTISAGRELPGLVKRRAAERAICEGRMP